MPNKLPQGWVECQLKEACEIITGSTPSTKNHNNYNSEDYPFFKPTDLNAGYYTNNSKDYVSEYAYNRARKLPKNSVLVTCIGATIGKTGIIRQTGICNQQINAILPNDYILSEFVYWYCISEHFQNLIKFTASATTLPILNKGNFEKLHIIIPPLNEQKRIVEKIESEFAKIDEGLEHLQQAKEKIKQYRQSVLKSAFEGKLTTQNPDDESAESLLQKINPKENFIHNDKLPQGWIECLIKDIAKNIQYGYTESANKDKVGPRFLRITDIQNDNVNWDLVPYCKIDDNIKSKYLLKNGDFVFARTGATVGKSYLIDNLKEEAVYASYLIRIRFYDISFTKYVKYYFQTSNYWNQISENKVGIGQPNVNGTVLSNLRIPFPPLNEQKRIVEEIEKRFAVADEVEKVVEQNIEKAKQLKQSILKKAFEGRLVPQAPTDEPASILLEKIKKEKHNDRK